MLEIQGLPPHLKNYRLAYFSYAATGEGSTIEAEILNGPKQKPTIGFPSLKNGGAKKFLTISKSAILRLFFRTVVNLILGRDFFLRCPFSFIEEEMEILTNAPPLLKGAIKHLS